MKLFSITKFAMVAAFGLAVLVGSSMDASAQGNSQWAHEKNRIRKQQKAYEKAQKRYYRVYRGDNYNGAYYQTDYRGVELLRQAINRGYQQGYRQGQLDRRYSRRDNYYGSGIYRSGSYGYQSYVTRSQYQYYFQQGFERGYYDGYHDESRYGYRTNNTMNILGAILGTILNVRQF